MSNKHYAVATCCGYAHNQNINAMLNC